MKDEITLLREENERLKQIISLLARQVAEGNGAVYSNAGLEMQPNEVFHSYPQEENQSKHVFQSDVQPDIGMKQVSHSNVQEDMGTKQVSQSNVIKEIESKQVSQSDVQADIGMKQPFHSYVPAGIDIKQAIQPNNQENFAVKQPVYSHPLENIATNAPVHSVPDLAEREVEPEEGDVASALSPYMLHSRRTGRHAAAKILIHLRTKEKNTNMELRKLTGMSATGVAKQLMALKKRGLILPVRFQQYTLSSVGLKLINESIARAVARAQTGA